MDGSFFCYGFGINGTAHIGFRAVNRISDGKAGQLDVGMDSTIHQFDTNSRNPEIHTSLIMVQFREFAFAHDVCEFIPSLAVQCF